MKKIFLLLLVHGLYSGHVLSQEVDSLVLSKQKNELKQVLQSVDKQIADRQQVWLDAQKQKLQYDTIGLAQYRFEMAQFKAERQKQEISFVEQHPDYFLCLNVLTDIMGPIPDNIRRDNNLFEKLDKTVQESEKGKRIKKLIDTYLAVTIGAQAPSFTTLDTIGNPVKLSDYQGKYLLLDFWASWCGPCREENPIVVKAYQQFKDKNFDILSVSLDKSGHRKLWIKAIHDDNLIWQQVSDLKFWDNEVAQLYGVRSIPQNFLIDPQGKIIAANLRGDALVQKLRELLNGEI
jgi:peroxiredoxin